MRYFQMIGLMFILSWNSVQGGTSFDVGKKAFNKVYDGDTLNIRLRLAHIDTPEIKGQCLAEIDLAKQARDYTQAFIKTHRNTQITVVGVGRYGRPLVEINADGRYLNEELVNQGLARPYQPGQRSWCQ